jgi:mRNA-degrading endonuclease RelE of RelBE toxin-antitoxin system
MSPKRGDRAAPPPVGAEYDIRFANSAAASGWEELARHAATNLRRAYDAIRSNPRSTTVPERHHRLKGSLASGTWKGRLHERWQYEVTGGGRIWYLIDDDSRTVWITYAGAGHPKETD